MRVAFLGTPDLAVSPLRGLHAAGHEIVLVVTGADARRGRGREVSPSPVKAAALELGLPVSHEPDDLLTIEADLGVVVAYGSILRKPLLDHLQLVNLHFSLLPRWRGAAPVERAILEDDAETGVCVMAIEEGLDTGGVFARATTPTDDKTLQELWSELSATGTQLLVDWLPTAFVDGRLVEPEPQAGEITYARKLTANDRRIDPAATARQQLATIRLGSAWTMIGEKRLKVLSGEIDDTGTLRILEVQPEGKRSMSFDAWRNGTPPDQRGPFA